MKIEGTCKILDKRYYRLTEIPDPADVRPEPVLRQALPYILDKFGRRECDVHYVVDQFRSIRLVAALELGHENSAHPQRLHCRGL
jgi:hypothetical protein